MRPDEPGHDDLDAARRIVERGYDVVAERYLGAVAGTENDPRGRFLDDFAARLPADAQVLELGCGAGSGPLGRFRYTGVDVSARQLALARARLPGATLLHADMSEVELPLGGFDGVAAVYSISHVPRRHHAVLLRRIAAWLRPGGLLLASLGARAPPDTVEEDWLGAPMFFSAFDAAENRALLEAAGFELLHDEVVTMREPEYGDAAFQWVLALAAR